jgi:hypothetical protein
MPVELRDEGLTAQHTIKLSWPTGTGEPDLVDFFRELADHWHGWDGERTWRSLDASMWIAARHDGKALVTLVATLQQSSYLPDAWLARVCLTVEAGEQMRSLAADVRAHFADLSR